MAVNHIRPLKGEVILANGSRVLFEALDWEFSYPVIDGKGCYILKAQEKPLPSHIIAWDPAKEDGHVVFCKVPNKQESVEPQICIDSKLIAEQMKHTAEIKKLKSTIKEQHELLEDTYALLKEYAETFHWETELKDRAGALLDRIRKSLEEQPEKESTKKQEESTDLFDVVSKFLGKHIVSNVTAQSDKDKIWATYHPDIYTWELNVWRPQGKNILIGRSKTKTDLQVIARMHNIDLTEGWKIINHQYRY